MNRYKITFSELKKISELLQLGHDDYFVNYLNEFEGIDIFDKFKNILKVWYNDVSSTLNFNINNKPTSINLSYIIDQLDGIGGDTKITDGNVEIIIDIPSQFQSNTDIIPIYMMVKYMNINGISMDFDGLTLKERKRILDGLPANIYNIIIQGMTDTDSKILKFDNTALKDFRLNFYANDPYMFMRGLFMNYDDMYFKNVIFHLSKRIDGHLLMNSTPLEIEYYSELYSKEMDSNP